MKASWLASSVGLIAFAVTATPTSAALIMGSLTEIQLGDPGYRFTLLGEDPLLDLLALEDGKAMSFQQLEANGSGLLPANWNPIVRHATEPSALVLLGTGLLGIATLLRRRQRPTK